MCVWGCLTPKLPAHQRLGPPGEKNRGVSPSRACSPLPVTREQTHKFCPSPHWPWGLTGTVYSRL